MPKDKPRRQSFWNWLGEFFAGRTPRIEPDPRREARDSFLGFLLGQIERPVEKHREAPAPSDTEQTVERPND